LVVENIVPTRQSGAVFSYTHSSLMFISFLLLGPPLHRWKSLPCQDMACSQQTWCYMYQLLWEFWE